MQLHNIIDTVHDGTFRFARTLLNDNPDLLNKYVATGVSLVGKALIPLNAFMKHLLIIQKIDPNTEPGEKQRKALAEAMDQALQNDRARCYDDDFDISWIKEKFQDATKNRDLTYERFMALTDVGKLQDKEDPACVVITANGNSLDPSTVVNTIAPESPKHETRLVATPDEVKQDANVVRGVMPFNPMADLRNALGVLEAPKGKHSKNKKSANKRCNRRGTP